jgi:hypothetical protein
MISRHQGHPIFCRLGLARKFLDQFLPARDTQSIHLEYEDQREKTGCGDKEPLRTAPAVRLAIRAYFHGWLYTTILLFSLNVFNILICALCYPSYAT